jgi:hypothetical protein
MCPTWSSRNLSSGGRFPLQSNRKARRHGVVYKVAQSRKIMNELVRKFLSDTVVNKFKLPIVTAQNQLQENKPADASLPSSRPPNRNWALAQAFLPITSSISAEWRSFSQKKA